VPSRRQRRPERVPDVAVGRLSADEEPRPVGGFAVDPIELAEAVTVGGLFFDRLGRIPREGDRVTLGSWDLTVEEMRGRRVGRVRARRRPAAPAQGQDGLAP